MMVSTPFNDLERHWERGGNFHLYYYGCERIPTTPLTYSINHVHYIK